MKISVFIFLMLAYVHNVAAQDELAQKHKFPIVTKDSKAVILYDIAGAKLDSISAHLFAQDIQRITGYLPQVITDVSAAKGNVIVIGNYQSSVVKFFLGSQIAAFNEWMSGKWECFGYKVLQNPVPGVENALMIVGSDARGTAYGVFDLSESLGVSPWYWWADVPVRQKKELISYRANVFTIEPTVKYRGIFLNDEDWGLRPWAAKTFEPEKKNIGPKTYAKIFELLLRLKANLIWPAMHPGTAPFYEDPENAATAAAYSIVVGTSHAEPMMRNNVGEWDEKTMGRFNYITNKQKVYEYWENRVKQTADAEVIYTLGMRGVHDSGMEGVKDAKEAIPLVEQVMKDQRGLLEKYNGKEATAIPQVFTAYKEVLDIYDKGLKIPEDVTLVWPDDNYGYISRLNNEDEKKRSGGTGVYYHASYWGRPHDYLWLNTANPALMQHEMRKAYDAGAKTVWVVNVGDIKPQEYAMQLFLDMAYYIHRFVQPSSVRKHMIDWHLNIFNDRTGMTTEAMWDYYALAFERRPEFMGWSQTEPTTKTKYTDYNHFYFGDEAQRRIDRYARLQYIVALLRRQMPGEVQNAFYQLLYYPVMNAAWMNKKFLYSEKAYLYAKQNRIVAYEYARMSRAVYDSIISETKFYNEQLSNGKWNNMMSMKPRDLPVFLPPDIPKLSIDKSRKWDVLPEGYDTIAYANNAERRLPEFTSGLKQRYFIDIFLTDSVSVSWSAKPSSDWVVLSQTSGKLQPVMGKSMLRIWVTTGWFRSDEAAAFIRFTAGSKQIDVHLNAKLSPVAPPNSIIESNGFVSISAGRFVAKSQNKQGEWITLQGLGHTGASVKAVVSGTVDTAALDKSAPFIGYEFWSVSTTSPKVMIYTLPTHPLNNKFSMRYAVRIDDSPIQIVDFKTIGRSEEWKQNVLRNSAIRTLQFPPLKPGLHKLIIYAIDPGVVLDRILINFGNEQKSYSVVPETYK